MKKNYRPDIDSFRAIATGAAILYKAQIVILGYQLFKNVFINVQN